MTRFTNLRQRERFLKGLRTPCLSNFIAPIEFNRICKGVFITAGLGMEANLEKYTADFDAYKSIMIKVLTDRLDDTYTELLHDRV